MLADRRVKIREIANIKDVKISTERICPTQIIGHEKAIGEMGAAFAHSGTKTESHDNFNCLDMFKRNPKEFLRFVTVDETWIHHYTSETKE